MKHRTYNILVSLIIAMSTIMVLVILHSMMPSGTWMHRLTCLLGGCLPNGLIQGFTYFLFSFGVMELSRLNARIQHEKAVFDHNDEVEMLESQGTTTITEYFGQLRRKYNYILAQMIVSMSDFTSTNRSVMEAMEYHNSLKELRERKEEGRQNLLRYVIWAIPSVGFVGTVIGIASSLGKAGKAGSAEGISEITGLLNIAFDTTLIALLLSIILVYLFHSFQEKAEGLYAEIDAYVLDHVVKRI